MKCKSLLFFWIVFFCPAYAHAQLWSGVVSPSRGTDWSHAGVSGGIPSAAWTQCGPTIAAYNGNTDPINGALRHTAAGYTGCSGNTYVQLGPGTFNLTSGGGVSNGIVFGGISNTALRGMGADQTFLVMGSGAYDSCSGGYHAGVCFNGSAGAYWVTDPAVNWTAGYARGTTVITLSSVAGIVPNQSIIGLDQCSQGNSGSPCSSNGEVDNGNYFDCDVAFNGTSGCAVNGPDGGNQRLNRPQNELFQVSAVNSATNQVTLIGSIRSPNWNSAETPQAFLVLAPDQYDGVENLSIDVTNTGANGIVGYYTANCWVKGVRLIGPNYAGIWWVVGVHDTFQDSYVYGNSHMGSGADIFTMNAAPASDDLFQNNIIQFNQVGIGNEGADSGSVYAYNLVLNDYNGNDGIYPAIFPHAGDRWQLYEGNVLNSYYGENYHGPKLMNTTFRNFYSGWESCANGSCGASTAKASATTAFRMVAYSRYHNVIGNVFGTPGYHNSYSTTAAFSTGNIYEIGSGNGSIPADPIVGSTLVRWGNYDVVNSSVLECTAASTPSAACVADERAVAAPAYPGLANPSTTFPASFYLASKPSWFGSNSWPAIGPDVTGGNVGQCGGALNVSGKYNGVAATNASQCAGSGLNTAWAGHINAIPAMNCFLNVMAGPPDGTNANPLTFSANACYGGGGNGGTNPPPAPPTNLTAVPN